MSVSTLTCIVETHILAHQEQWVNFPDYLKLTTAYGIG